MGGGKFLRVEIASKELPITEDPVVEAEVHPVVQCQLPTPVKWESQRWRVRRIPYSAFTAPPAYDFYDVIETLTDKRQMVRARYMDQGLAEADLQRRVL